MNKPLVTVGKTVPNFQLPSTSDKTFSLSDLLSQQKNLVLYFYPKDCTSGCTLEGRAFRDNFKAFQKLKTEILGVSRDTLKLHEKFKSEESFPFELLSDTEESLCRLFDVIKEKNMYGKKVQGIQRSTFLIDSNGILQKEWRNVKAEGHAEEVFSEVKKFFG